jgi:hypothetical protein
MVHKPTEAELWLHPSTFAPVLRNSGDSAVLLAVGFFRHGGFCDDGIVDRHVSKRSISLGPALRELVLRIFGRDHHRRAGEIFSAAGESFWRVAIWRSSGRCWWRRGWRAMSRRVCGRCWPCCSLAARSTRPEEASGSRRSRLCSPNSPIRGSRELFSDYSRDSASLARVAGPIIAGIVYEPRRGIGPLHRGGGDSSWVGWMDGDCCA